MATTDIATLKQYRTDAQHKLLTQDELHVDSRRVLVDYINDLNDTINKAEQDARR